MNGGTNGATSVQTTIITNAWNSPNPDDTATDPNSLLTVKRSGWKEAYTATTSGIEYDRLHGWYLGVDCKEASATNVTIANYPDIGQANSYNPYTFSLKQFIKNTLTQVPNISTELKFDLYIGETPSTNISWAPTPATALNPSLSPQFLLNRLNSTLDLPFNGSLNDLNRY